MEQFQGYPFELFNVDEEAPLYGVSKGDIVIVNLEGLHPKNNELVLIDIEGKKEVSRAERSGGILRLFPHHFINKDIVQDKDSKVVEDLKDVTLALAM